MKPFLYRNLILTFKKIAKTELYGLKLQKFVVENND